MPGAMRKMGVYLGLVEEDDLYDDADNYDRAPVRPTEYAGDPRSGRAGELARPMPRERSLESEG